VPSEKAGEVIERKEPNRLIRFGGNLAKLSLEMNMLQIS
jgi:hypothetical protein